MVNIIIDDIQYNFKEVFKDLDLLTFIELINYKNNNIVDYQYEIIRKITGLDEEVIDNLDYVDMVKLFNELTKYPDKLEIKNIISDKLLINPIENYDDIKVKRSSFKVITERIKSGDNNWILYIPGLFYDGLDVELSKSIKSGDILPFLVKILNALQIQVSGTILEYGNNR